MIKLVICDDHVLISEGIELMLQNEPDISVERIVSSGKEAIDFLKENDDIDLMILDISMPDMDGLLVLDELQRLELNTKVLILTMHDKIDYIRNAVKKGVKGYLLKSTESNKLIKAVKKIVDGETYFDQKLTEILMSDLVEESDEKPKGKIQLTSREMDILKLLVKGKKTKEIADFCFISINTVQTHKKNIYSKLNIHSVSELINYAYKHNYIIK